MFEFNEHSIPAFTVPVEIILAMPFPTIVTELAEIETAPGALRFVSSKTIVTRLASIETGFVVDDPRITSWLIAVSLAVLHVSFPADTFTAPSPISHVIVQIKE
jgi:hypothetical protein